MSHRGWPIAKKEIFWKAYTLKNDIQVFFYLKYVNTFLIISHVIHWINVGLMLGQRRRWWTNIKLTLFQRPVLTGGVNIAWKLDWRNIQILILTRREGYDAMARARGFANVTACRVVSNPALCRIFRRKLCFSPLNIGHYFDVVFLGKALYPHMLHLT